MKKEKYVSLWVNWEKKIISFHPAPGFEELRFPNRKQMMKYAVEKTRSEYAIQ